MAPTQASNETSKELQTGTFGITTRHHPDRGALKDAELCFGSDTLTAHTEGKGGLRLAVRVRLSIDEQAALRDALQGNLDRHVAMAKATLAKMEAAGLID